jgi:4-hydroxy-tetrahydrodipicolinate synthase
MMPILPTTIDTAGRIDEASQRRLVQYCLQNGAAAIGHFGIASEVLKVSDTERRQVSQVIIAEVAGRVPVFFGVTGASNRIAVYNAKLAEQQGANMLMLAPPFNQSPSRQDLYAYYRDVATAVKLPIIIQDGGDPGLMPVELMLRLHAELENAQYIKSEALEFLRKSAELIRDSGGQVPIIGGFGGKHMIHLLRMGVTAFMTGTECLDLHYAVVATYLAGDVDKAVRLHDEKMLPYLAFYLEYPHQLLKQMLHRRGVIDCPLELPPGSRPMSPADQQAFDWVFHRTGLDSRWPQIRWQNW